MNNSSTHIITGLAIAISTIGFGMSQSVFAAETGNDQRYVNQVMWDKSGAMAVDAIKNNHIPVNQANLVFIRTPDMQDLQKSINIGIDGRFQTSLQGGHYSQVKTCTGSRHINLTTTGQKNNDLSRSSKSLDVMANRNHYFQVKVADGTGALVLTEVNEQTARQLLNGLTEQTHQISRVQANCKPSQPVRTQQPTPLVVENQTPPPVDVKSEMNAPIKLDVLFEFDSSVVPSAYNQRIQEVAMLMRKYPNVRVSIEGHTDGKGSASYNMGLSMRRAQAVKAELVNKYGADAHRISTTGYGETRPIDSNATPQGRQNNRRVVAIISEVSNR